MLGGRRTAEILALFVEGRSFLRYVLRTFPPIALAR